MLELPSWYPSPETETKPAPMPLLLVQAFVNTYDFEQGVDLLADSEAAKTWLVNAGLVGLAAKPTESQAALMRAVREAIRELLEGRKADVAPLRKVADARSARLTVDRRGQLALEHAGEGELLDGLFQLLLIVRGAQENGTWSRLRVCANDECRWAFYDRSRNQQGHWCDMAVCGNRLKNRQLRARQRGA